MAGPSGLRYIEHSILKSGTSDFVSDPIHHLLQRTEMVVGGLFVLSI